MNILHLLKPKTPNLSAIDAPAGPIHLREALPHLAGGERVIQLWDAYRKLGPGEKNEQAFHSFLFAAFQAIDSGAPPKQFIPAPPPPEPEPSLAEMQRQLNAAGWTRHGLDMMRQDGMLPGFWRRWRQGLVAPSEATKRAAREENAKPLFDSTPPPGFGWHQS